jgi:hypothetical protein
MNKIIISGLVAVALFGANIAFAQSYSYGYPNSILPTQAGCVNLVSDLSYGSQGADVSSLQGFLVSQNFPGGGAWMVTGYFGNATLTALKNFQQGLGLPMTGVADAATRSAIARVSCNYSSGYQYQNNYSTSYPYLSYPYSYNYNNFNYTYPYVNQNVALTSMSLNTGTPGTSVTLYGTGFDPSNNSVYFGNQALPGIPSQNGTALTFSVPNYYGYSNAYNQNVQIYVTNSHGTSNSLAFTLSAYPYYGYNNYCNGAQYGYSYGYTGNCYQYQTPSQNLLSPSLIYLNPTSGKVGDSVTVFGNGFTTTGNTVHFGTGVITNLNSPDNQSVSFQVPANLTGFGSQLTTLSTYQVSVTNNLGYTTNALPFTVTSLGSSVAPTIKSINGPTSLQSGVAGTWTLVVNNPSGAYLTTSVTWGDEGTYGYAAQPAQTTYAQGQTTLTFTHTYYTTGMKNISFVVSNTSGQSNTTTATVSVTGSGTQGNVTLSSLAPNAGSIGSQVTVYGSGFTFANTIHFGIGAITNAYSANGTTLVFTVPSYLSPYCTSGIACPMYVQQVTPGTYNVSIENQNGISQMLPFQVQ